MHGLILAGGEGVRLAADGVTEPKALVPVRGTPQLIRLVDVLSRLGCRSVTAMVHRDVAAATALATTGSLPPVRLIPCRTPSSLHTLAAGLEAVPPGAVFCTLVDSVMPWRDWQRAHRAATRALGAGADAALIVTPYVDDERPLYVECDADGWVRALHDGAPAGRLVTGGVYAFAPSGRPFASRALAAGADRLRAGLSRLVAEARVTAVEVARVVDLDHRRDLLAAETVLGPDGE